MPERRPRGPRELALPPRGLPRIQAAAYCGLAPSTFDARVKDRCLPQAFDIGRTRIWDRVAIDRALDVISGFGPVAEEIALRALRKQPKGAPHHKVGIEPPKDLADSVVYFVEAPLVGLIKIGWSGELRVRLRALRLSSPIELILLGYVPGDAELEGSLHAKFAAERRHGEWFVASPELRSRVTKILAENGRAH